jgi:hypothetical protein
MCIFQNGKVKFKMRLDFLLSFLVFLNAQSFFMKHWICKKGCDFERHKVDLYHKI